MELYTIIAQIINFSVLIFLLNKFLYKPVLKIMDKRRNDIKQKIEETEKKLEESDKLKADYLNKLNEVEKENIILKKQAVEDVKKFKELELQKAMDDVLNKKERFKDYLHLEQKSLIENFNDYLMDTFFEYSNNILRVIANSNLQTEIVNSFIEKLNGLSKDKIDSVNELKPNTIYILSNSNLNDDERNTIKNSLLEKGFIFDSIEYNIDEGLILGIELKAKSYVLSWNVKELTADFIASMNRKMIDKK